MVDISQQTIDSDGFVPAKFELIPKGQYKMAAISSEKKDTNAGDGEYINFEFQITEGEHQGRKLWKLCMISTTSTEKGPQTGVKMGFDAITGLALACGIRAPQDTSEMHGIEIIGDIVIKKPTPKNIKAGYSDSKNEIRLFLSIEEAAKRADAATPQGSAAPAQATTTTDPAPWKQS